MTIQRVPPSPPAPCPCRLELGGVEWTCVKKRGHKSCHELISPIVFTSRLTGLTVVIEKTVEWEEVL